MSLIKTAAEIQTMRIAGSILAAAMKKVCAAVRVGVSLKELDAQAYRCIIAYGAEPAFKGYEPQGAARPFPATLCTSLNDVVVHGIPTGRTLREGDIVKLDLGVRHRGYYADAAVTVPVGTVPPAAHALIAATKEALAAGIHACIPGNRLGDVGHHIARTVRQAGFFVIRGLTGHGIGRELHEEPTVMNEGKPGEGMILKAGLVLAIEVMTGASTGAIVQRKDDSYATADRGLSAHVEHTVAIREQGPVILTNIDEKLVY